MSIIDRMAVATTLSEEDLIPLFSAYVGADVAATLTTLVSWMQARISASGGFLSQYSAPSSSGFSVTVSPVTQGASVFLLLTPASGYASGTIIMPAQPVHQQEVLVSCTQSVAALAVTGNGSTVNGAPTSLAANGSFRMRFDGVSAEWYAVGLDQVGSVALSAEEVEATSRLLTGSLTDCTYNGSTGRLESYVASGEAHTITWVGDVGTIENTTGAPARVVTLNASGQVVSFV